MSETQIHEITEPGNWQRLPYARFSSSDPFSGFKRVNLAMEEKRIAGRRYFNPGFEPRHSKILDDMRSEGRIYIRLKDKGIVFHQKNTSSGRPDYASSQRKAEEEQSRDVLIHELQQEVELLKFQLRSASPYKQLYRLGATGLLLAVLSITVWTLTGVGLPFHPVFAFGMVPTCAVIIAIAFLVRPRNLAQRTPKA